MIRFLLPIFPDAVIFFNIYAQILGLFSIFVISLISLRQIDLKKIIAYSSIIHMNYITCSLFSLNIYSTIGSILYMISHGFISSGLFILVGYLYERYGTRNIKFFCNLTYFMPIFAIFFFIYNLANMSFPGFISFLGEFLLIYGIMIGNTPLSCLVLFFIIFISASSI